MHALAGLLEIRQIKLQAGFELNLIIFEAIVLNQFHGLITFDIKRKVLGCRDSLGWTKKQHIG